MRRERTAAVDAQATARPRRYSVAGHDLDAPPLPAGLHVVATPIGNLRDVTLRALETLAAADLIACEDTRVSRKLTDHYAIATPLTAYHEHNAAAVRPRLLQAVAQGQVVALISDAGTPLISDPGYKLVREAREAGHAIYAAPGASAVLAALAVSGLPTDRFTFEGFLPPKTAARQVRIAALARFPSTLVLFESGPRLAASLADLAAGLGAREAAVCRELTKLHEEVRRADLAQLAAHYANAEAPRGEIAIVIGPPAEAERPSAAAIDDLLRAALTRTSVKDAVQEVASITGEPRGEIYRQALALAKSDQPRDTGDDSPS
jgi:16S rRNA (cytidine1402-2'-O)-methyltransferase